MSSIKSKQETPWSKIGAFFSGLSNRVKYGLGGMVLLAVVSAGWGAHSVKSNQFGDLYPLRLDSEDVREISTVLIDNGIEHAIPPTNDNIQLHPDSVRQARALLASYSLPRREPEPQIEDSKMPTADMRKAQERRRLEGDLVHTLRRMDGINDAAVKLAVPPKSFFTDEKLNVKASVFLNLANGYKMKPDVAKGIASLVSHSVPELSIENVTLLDGAGRVIEVEEDKPLRALSEREKELQDKLQVALSRIFGDERVHAIVNVEYDTSREDRKRFNPGEPGQGGSLVSAAQRFEETLSGETEDQAKSYDTLKESLNYVYAQNSVHIVRLEPKIDRITATVLVDGASEDEIKEIQGLVRGAIGIDETRTDEVVVCGLPWNHPKMWDNQLAIPAPVEEEQETAGYLPQLMALGGGMFLLGLLGAGLLNRRTRPFFGLPLSGAKENNSPQGIVDHVRQKDGSQTAHETTIQNGGRMEALEDLVNSRPEKVATLLRTTWLQ